MFRKVRLSAPADRHDDLVAAAKHAWLSIDDSGIDTTAEHGWPYRGDGRAIVIVITDDDLESATDIEASVRGAHIDLTGELDASFITLDQAYVMLPDAMPATWYATAVPLAEALHDAESELATCSPEDLPAVEAKVAAARTAVIDIVTPAIKQATEHLSKLNFELVMTGMVELLER